MLDPLPARRFPRFGLGSALGVSVLLHLLLAALGWWLPVARAERREPTEDTVLRFSFSQPRTDVSPQIGAAGPPIPAVREVPQPQPRPPIPPDTPPSAPGEDLARRAPSPASGSEPGPSGSAYPLDDPGPAPVEAEAEDEPRIDLNRALRDFGQTLDRARAARRGTGTSEFVPDVGQFPTTGYGMGNLSFETRDFDWSDYARQIYIAIWRAWHNRLYQTVDEFEKWAYANGWFLNHANRIRFVIERSGQVSSIVVESESGCDPLDASATQALAEVILPPLPPDFPKQSEVVRARFLAEGSIQGMRPSLTRLKRYGLF